MTLSYELCLKLKTAGYPQDKVAHLKPHPEGKYENCATMLSKDGTTFAKELCVVNPTLSELIEACGDEFECLFRNNSEEWIAAEEIENGYHEWGFIGHTGAGKTPEEAVAHLFLELHKK